MSRPTVVLTIPLMVVLSLLFAGLPAAEAAGQYQTTPTHQVRSGDTLWAIAVRYGTTVEGIMQANGLTSSLIRPGQQLTIPGANRSQPARQATLLEQRCSGDTVHTVRAGETLGIIAGQLGISITSLKQANGLVSDTILPGQVLRVPCDSSSPASASGSWSYRLAGCGDWVVVQGGESLSSIAARCWTSVTALKAANGLVTSNLFPGQSLRMPGSIQGSSSTIYQGPRY